MSASGIASLIGAAAPGIAQGVGNYMDTSAAQKQANQALPTTNAASDQTKDQFLNGGMQDAGHPVWGVLNNLTGNPGNAALPGPGASAPSGGIPMPAMPAAQMGAPISTPGMPMAQPGGGQTTQFQNGGVVGYQNGGVVGYQNGGPVIRENYGLPTAAPEFERGPAIPIGMENGGPVPGYMPTPQSTGLGQGITPGSTEGQILTMDAGGVVPTGFVPQQGISGVPMNGRGAALIEGLQAGQTLGHNFQQAWQTNRARSALDPYLANVGQADVDQNPQGGAADQTNWLDHAKNAVEGFFHHVHEGTLDDNHKPNTPADGSPNAAPVPDDSAAPAGAPAPSPVPTGAAPSAAPAPGGAAPPPAPAAAPGPGGPPPAGAPQPAPGAAQGQPKPVSVQQQATQNVVKQVAANPEVRSGIPDKPPEQSGLAHSLTPDYWAKLNKTKMDAVRAAARAGEDPAKVYESLTAMQNAHFQGQILKQLGTANTAFANGDMKSVQQALKNVNYYLPNGQDIQFKSATAQDAAADPSVKPGDMMYRNPFYGMYGHEHDPEFTKLDAVHLQSLGNAALDPRTVQEAQLKAYSAQQEAQTKNKTAEGALLAGSGKNKIGTADIENADTRRAQSPVDQQLKQAHARLYLSEAGLADRKPVNTGGNGPKVTQASVRARQNDVSSYIDSAVLGRKQTAPLTNPDGSPSISAAAGKNVNNQQLVPTVLKGLDEDQIARTKQYGASFAAANPEMSKEDAAEYGARIVRMEGMKNGPTHPGPDGKPRKDLITDDPKQPGVVHLWVGNHYKSFYTQPNVSDDTGPEASPLPSHSGGGDESEGAPGASRGEVQEE